MSTASPSISEDFVLVPYPSPLSPPSPPSPLTSQPTIPFPFITPHLNGCNVYEVTVPQLQDYYASGVFTIKEYTQFCIDRIFATNPYLEAVIEVNPDVLSIAEKLDDERLKARPAGTSKGGKGERVLGMMHGVPVLVKDTMATADRLQTTGGSWALLGSTVPKDAFIVSRLRAAGAIILGKTNLDEWAGMRGDVYSCGYTARGGQCRNPYLLTRSPSGSSSGSAVTVSANIIPIAFGTETDTSIIGPALANGVAGIKPTVGLTSRAGIIPISSTQDSIGPYGRTVADAAIALDVIASPDPDDTFTIAPDRQQPASFTSCLASRHALYGAKFGLPIHRFWDLAPYPQRAVADRVLALLQLAGASLVPVELPCAAERIHADGHWDWERYGETRPEKSEITVSKVQTYRLMQTYLSQLRNTPIASLEDVVRYNDENNGSEAGHGGLPAWEDGQDLFRKCVATHGVKDATYHSALGWIRSQCRENGIDAALKHTTIDPVTGDATDSVLDALLFCDIKMAGTCIAAQAGYPVIALPIGLDSEGMPVGLTVQHTKWEDGRCVKWASAIEDLLQHHNELQRAQSAQTTPPQTRPVGAASPQPPLPHAEAEDMDDEDRQRSELLGRLPPRYKAHLRKNIPVRYTWTYKGAPRYNVRELKEIRRERGTGNGDLD